MIMIMLPHFYCVPLSFHLVFLFFSCSFYHLCFYCPSLYPFNHHVFHCISLLLQIYLFFVFLPSVKLFVNLLCFKKKQNNFYIPIIKNHYLRGCLQCHMSYKLIIFIM